MVAFAVAALLSMIATATADSVEQWRTEWPKTDFSKRAVNLDEIIPGGVPKGEIPPIDAPRFVLANAVENLVPTEPVISLVMDGEARAYPLQTLIWHQVVNDVVGGVPVAVTYDPLCNAAIVFDRRIRGRALVFGVTGKLRKSNLVMYDRETESWWQQFTGEAIAGALTGARLEMIPARLESVARFKERAPGGRVLVPDNPDFRSYGTTPYVGYDSAAAPFLFIGELPRKVPPMNRVVAVGDRAWALDLLRQEGQIETGDLVLSWSAGQNSALDTTRIADGRDVGNVIVQRRDEERRLKDIPYRVVFAFAFRAFEPDGVLHTIAGPVRLDE